MNFRGLLISYQSDKTCKTKLSTVPPDWISVNLLWICSISRCFFSFVLPYDSAKVVPKSRKSKEKEEILLQQTLHWSHVPSASMSSSENIQRKKMHEMQIQK